MTLINENGIIQHLKVYNSVFQPTIPITWQTIFFDTTQAFYGDAIEWGSATQININRDGLYLISLHVLPFAGSPPSLYQHSIKLVINGSEIAPDTREIAATYPQPPSNQTTFVAQIGSGSNLHAEYFTTDLQAGSKLIDGSEYTFMNIFLLQPLF